MNITRARTACAVFFCLITPAFSLGPHECIIIANRRTTESVELANFYADLRQIPPINIIHLDLPDKVLEADASLSPDEFQTLIYEPVQKTLRERNIANHALVWLYSLSFPTRIDTEPPVSLTGMTFCRGNPPPAESIDDGTWISPIYVGPDRADGPKSPSAALEEFTLRLTTNMPIPSMMLGWAGSRGMTLSQIKDHLRRSASGDASHPSATVYFEDSDDVRSRMRQWQFEPAASELSGLGIAALTVSSIPSERPDLMGILSGKAAFSRNAYGMLQPGAYAEHLTSFAALFHDPYQTKLTEWLRLGASGSTGTIVEPGSTTKRVLLWAKFPQARLYAHYARGCTLIESLYLATRCPLQLFMVGDALCSPWAKPPGISLISMSDDEDEPLHGKVEFIASSWGGFGQRPPTTIFFLDGRPVNQPGTKPEFSVDGARLHDGNHELRVVAYANEAIRHQGFDRKLFTTRNRNRSATISGYEQRQKVDYYHPLTFTVDAEGSPREAAIVAQERVVARKPFTNGVPITVSPSLVGAGPVSFQAVVVYADNEPVRSEPLLVDIRPLNSPPKINGIMVATNSEDARVYSLDAEDAEGDDITKSWFADVIKDPKSRLTASDRSADLDRKPGNSFSVSADEGAVLTVEEIDQPNRMREIRSRFSFADAAPVDTAHTAGIVFNYQDDKNYMYWGVNGQLSAWVLAQVVGGRENRILSRGAFIDTGKEHTLGIISLGMQKIGLFADGELLAFTDASFSAGKIGLRTGAKKVIYNELLVSPASAYRTYFREERENLVVEAQHLDALPALIGGATDLYQAGSMKPVE